MIASSKRSKVVSGVGRKLGLGIDMLGEDDERLGIDIAHRDEVLFAEDEGRPRRTTAHVHRRREAPTWS